MSPAVILILAVLIDQVIGELPRCHPLVGFGNLAMLVEGRLNCAKVRANSHIITRLKGALALAAICIPFAFIAYVLTCLPLFGSVASLAIVYLAIGAKSLSDHALAVEKALAAHDLALARNKVALMVSRDTGSMQEVDVVRATIESVLENGNDAIFGAMFWFLVAGAPAAVLFRLVNTLDAMWGYKTERFLHFGWAAARLDDLLNWIPARLTALTYTLMGDCARAWQCWRSQGHTWYSPNAGPVMASGAGALGLQLGGPASYHGRMKDRPLLGTGKTPDQQDIARSLALLKKGIYLWVVLSIAGAFLHA